MPTFHTSQNCRCQCPCLRSRPLLTHAAAGDLQTLTGRSGSVSCGGRCFSPLGPGVHRVLSVPSKSLWEVWGLILTWLSPSYHLVVTSPWSLDVRYHFLVGSNILLSRTAQQLLANLVLSQQKTSARPSTLSSWHGFISHASNAMLKIFQAGLQQYMNWELPDVQTGFRKGRGTRNWNQIANIPSSSRKQGNSRKLSYSASLTTLKPLTVWITTNRGKFLKRGEYQTTLPVSW